LDKGVPTLQHQRPQKEAEVEKKDDWYVKGAQVYFLFYFF